MKFRFFYLLCVLCVSALNVFALDREAFTFTDYDLSVRIEPEQQRLGVRGKITLRNDSQIPQKIAVLQISSSLDWRSIRAGDKPLQYVTQPYASDIDHTGALSEAIVTLPQALAPHGSVTLDIAYEGVVPLDATRFTRIGAPEETAKRADWDQIGTKFTAIRGVGYVAWYPIATEAADLSEEGDSLSEAIGRWKEREADAHMAVTFNSTVDATILFSGVPSLFMIAPEPGIVKIAVFDVVRMGATVPTFVLATYKKTDVKGISSVYSLPGYEGAAASYGDLLAALDPLPTARYSGALNVAQLPDSDATAFVTDQLAILPLQHVPTQDDRLLLVYAVARQQMRSPRPWIVEGLAHYAQVLDIEKQHGHQAALDYLAAHLPLLVQLERENAQASSPASAKNEGAGHSLIESVDGAYIQSKSMWVWWMLRDLLGPDRFLPPLAYEGTNDKNPSYMQGLLQKGLPRDLEWFFDDWVYRDRGLPDFKVESAFSRKTMNDLYILTVTIENLGAAGAEVPVTVTYAGGTVTKRIEVRGKSKAVTRIEMTGVPQEVVVNDGSVPESDMMNNTYKIEAVDAPK